MQSASDRGRKNRTIRRQSKIKKEFSAQKLGSPQSKSLEPVPELPEGIEDTGAVKVNSLLNKGTFSTATLPSASISSSSKAPTSSRRKTFRRHMTVDGDAYFSNVETDETTWYMPENGLLLDEAEDE